MSESPPTPGEFEDVDEHYRRVTALEKGGPSESVRRAVLEHAARLAAERKAAEVPRNNVVSISAAKPRTRRPTWWRPAAVGTLAAASLAGLLVAPQFLPPRQAAKSVSAPASVAQPSPTEEVPAYADRTAGSIARNTPAAEQNLAKRQMAPAAPSTPAAPSKAVTQDAIVAQDKLQAQEQPEQQGAAADSAEVQSEARRTRNQALSGIIATAPAVAAAPAPAPQSAVPMGAARLLDPAAELRHAAGGGDMPALRAALERRPLIDARDADGRTALMLAALHGRGEAVAALLAAGANPNAADAHGATPLQAALDGGQADIVAALRRAGAR